MNITFLRIIYDIVIFSCRGKRRRKKKKKEKKKRKQKTRPRSKVFGAEKCA